MSSTTAILEAPTTSLYTVIEEYGFPGDHVWFSQDMDGVPPNEVMWEFFVGECGGIDGIFQEDQEGVQAYPVPFEDQLFLGNVGVSPATYHMQDVWVQTVQSMDWGICLRGAICCEHRDQFLRLSNEGCHLEQTY